MKKLNRDVRGEILSVLVFGMILLSAVIGIFLVTIKDTAPLEIRITNTSAEPLPVEIYINGVFYIADTIEPKQVETYEYKNGFWGPGSTIVVVKLPNTLFEKEGWGGQTVSFVFE